MEINGKIIQVFPTKSGVSAKTGKEWASQDAVLEIPGQYVRHMLFTIFGEENIQRVGLYVGANVNVSFDIDAHEYQGKYYNSIKAYSVVHMDEEQKPEAKQPAHPTRQAIPQQQPTYQQPLFNEEQSTDNPDDLPF